MDNVFNGAGAFNFDSNLTMDGSHNTQNESSNSIAEDDMMGICGVSDFPLPPTDFLFDDVCDDMALYNPTSPVKGRRSDGTSSRVSALSHQSNSQNQKKSDIPAMSVYEPVLRRANGRKRKSDSINPPDLDNYTFHPSSLTPVARARSVSENSCLDKLMVRMVLKRFLNTFLGW